MMRHPLDLQLVGDVRRGRGASAGRPTGGRRRGRGSVPPRPPRRGGRGWPRRWRTARRRADRPRGPAPSGWPTARAGRQVVDAVEHPVEQPGEPRPGQLDLGLAGPAGGSRARRRRLGRGGRARRAASSCRRRPRRRGCARRPWPSAARGRHVDNSSRTRRRPRSAGRARAAEVRRAAASACGQRRRAAAPGTPAVPVAWTARRPVASRDVGFTRAELESFRDATVPDLVGPGLRLLFVGHQPRAVDGGHRRPTSPTRATASTRRCCGPASSTGPIDRGTGMTDDDRGYLIERGIGITNLVARATPRAVGAVGRRAARRRRAPARLRRRAPPARRRRRRRDRLPRGVRAP